MHQITTTELAAIIEKESAVVLDVRETTAYAFGHIPGSVLIPLKQLKTRWNELCNEEAIYVICQTGSESEKAYEILRNEGFEQVFHVDLGIDGWTGPIQSDFE